MGDAEDDLWEGARPERTPTEQPLCPECGGHRTVCEVCHGEGTVTWETFIAAMQDQEEKP